MSTQPNDARNRDDFPVDATEIKQLYRFAMLEAIGHADPSSASRVLTYLLGINADPLGQPDPYAVSDAQQAAARAVLDLITLEHDGGDLHGLTPGQLAENWMRETLAEIETAIVERVPWILLDER